MKGSENEMRVEEEETRERDVKRGKYMLREEKKKEKKKK